MAELISKNKPLISVIMPIHDRFNLVDEAIESIIAQTYRPIELIIIDDFSTYPYKPTFTTQQNLDGITIIKKRLKSNLGPGFAREVGRSEFTGDFVCYMDSDDICQPDKFKKQVEALIASPASGMCYCQTAEFIEMPIEGQLRLRSNNQKGYDSFLPILFHERPWSTGACLWTKISVLKIGAWIDTWTWEDFAYDCMAGCLNISICFIPEVLYFKRQNDDEARLSNRDTKKAEIHKAKSVVYMADTLSKYKKFDNILIKNYFIVFVLKPNIKKLIKFGEFDLAKGNIEIIESLAYSWLQLITLKLLRKTICLNKFRISSFIWRGAFKYLIHYRFLVKSAKR